MEKAALCKGAAFNGESVRCAAGYFFSAVLVDALALRAVTF